MRTHHIRRAAAAVAACALALVASAPASADPPPRDHGHILVLDVESAPGTFPPVPISASGCIDLGNDQALPQTAHHDHLHVDFTGGAFRERTGHIVIPTWPFEAFGETVPWHDCDDFMALFGLG